MEYHGNGIEFISRFDTFVVNEYRWMRSDILIVVSTV